ncbi:class I adenylate-forming enzyme family protein [Kitasatospora sp. NPDC001683]
MLADIMTKALRDGGGRAQVTDRHTRLTHRELDRAADEQATQLRALLGPGERHRVAIQSGNSVAYLVAYLAVLKAGSVPFLIDRASGPREVQLIWQDCGLDLLLQDEAAAAPEVGTPRGTLGSLLATGLPAREDAPALHDLTQVCRFTSGSTGRPNCIEFAGTAVHRAAANWAEGTGLSGGDSILCFASLSNGLAFNTSLLSAFLVGADLHLGSGLPTGGAVSRLLASTAATRLVGFPALYESLVRRPADGTAPPNLRMAVSSAAPLRPDTRSEFTARTGVPLQNYFGVAEAGPLTFAADPLTDPGLGQPLPGVRLRAGTAAAPEVVQVHSQSMGTRYLNAPGVLEGRIDQDGFYHTGDTGYLSDGSLVLTGRTSQKINVGGRKIDALEVTHALLDVPGITDAVVLETPDRHGGSALAAVITAEPGFDPAEGRRRLSERIAAYKVPSLIRVVPQIPRGSTGKPAMAQLRGLFDTTGQPQ